MLSKKFSFSEINEGQTVRASYKITQEIYDGFLKVFKDVNPLHVDANHARQSGFSDKVMHGTILQGFLSHFIGMEFPGERSLLLSVDLRYQKPSYLGDEIEVEAKVSQKVESHQVLVLDFTFQNKTQNLVAAKGRVQVKVRENV